MNLPMPAVFRCTECGLENESTEHRFSKYISWDCLRCRKFTTWVQVSEVQK